MRSTATRVALIAALVVTGLGLSSCRDGRPGRNHPHQRDHDRDHDGGRDHQPSQHYR